ncbi:hypothetical protein Tco_0246563 [Tanacetum coccineum]
MWESAKTVAPTPNSVIVRPNVDVNFTINSTHLKMILENKFDGYLRADPHDHIREFLAICNMFRYGETQSEAVMLFIFPFSLCDDAKTWFNELNEESITSWEQMRKSNRRLVTTEENALKMPWAWSDQRRNYSNILSRSRRTHSGNPGRNCQRNLPLQKSNQALQFLDNKVIFKLDWSTKSQNKHHQKSVAFADGSNNNNNDNSRLMEKLEALTIKMDSQFQSLKEEMHEIHNKYYDLRDNNSSENRMNDDTPMYERHEVNFIQSEVFQNQNSHDLYSHQSHHDPNDSEKSLTELNNDMKQDLEDFKRCMRSKRTVHWRLFARDDDLEKSITKFLDGQRVSNMFVNNNVNDMIIKMKQNEKNFQTKIKNMERKLDEWSKSQNVFSEQMDRTDPPLPQAHTEHVNVVFTRSGKPDDSLETQKDPPPPIIVNNKIEKDRPFKTSKKGYHVVETKEYPFREYISKIPYPQRPKVDHSHLHRIVKES